MSTNFPGSLDTLTNPSSSDSMANVSHSAQHANANDAIEALQAKVGADSSAVTTSHDYKIAQLESGKANTSHTHTASQVTDFDTEVANNSAVALNTAKISFDSASSTKLTGIEALADVTDATNVAGAGAVMESDTSTVLMQFVADEDDMASNSNTKVPTQQSVKAYVDSEVAGVGGGGTWGSITGTLSDQTDLQSALDEKQATITGLTASGSELNILDGATLTTTELNYVDGVTSAIQTQLGGKVGTSGNETIGGTKTFSSDVLVPDEAYDATAWNGSLEVPTKNALRDKIESIVVGGGATWGSVAGTLSDQTDLQTALDAKQSKIMFNVKDYGAVGDGTTNDTTAFQDAIEAAEVAGGTVWIPEGTYHVVMPTVVTGGITVRGAGWSSKILLADETLEADGLTNGIWVNEASEVIIRDLAIDGNFENVAKDGSFHSSSTLWDPVISEYGSGSVKNYVMNGSGGSIDATTYLRQRIPIRITDSSNVFVENCLIENSVSAGILADGTSVNSCSNLLFSNNRIRMTWDNGIYFHQGVQYATAVNNIISDTTYNGVSAVYCDHIIVANNNIRKAGPSDSDSGGIQINGSSNCDVVGNLIDECQFYGIDLLSTQETNITGGDGGNSVYATNTTVMGNAITGCHANDYPSHNAPGINVFGSDQAIISGNSISDCDFGISMGSRALETAVISNRISRCSSIGINVGNSADVVNTVIKSNYVAYNGSHGVFAYAPARYEGNTFIGNNGMGLSLADPPSGMPNKVDFVNGNTILDNTDSGILTNGGSNSIAVIENNIFGNSQGVLFHDGSITYGDETLDSNDANFVSSDVGLPVFLINQGANDVLTTTTIASVTDENTVELAGDAQATQTGLTFFIGRGVSFHTASSAGSTLTAPSGTFLSTDGGKLVTIMTDDPNPTVLLVTTVSSYSSDTQVTLSDAIGTHSDLRFFINRSQGQQARAINNFNDNPLIMRNNTTIGIPEYLGGGGTQNVTTKAVQNVRDPLLPQDVATKNYVDSLIQSKSITIESPTASEDISLFYTDDAITITKMIFVITGSTSATTTIRHSTDRSATGNEVVTSGTTANSTTTGNVVTSFNDATVPADSFVWLETTSLSGTPTTLHVTILYTID